MTAVAAAREQLRLGVVISEAFRLVQRHPATLLLLAVFLAMAPAAATAWANQQATAAEQLARASRNLGPFWAWTGARVAVAYAAGGVDWIFQGAVAIRAARDVGLASQNLRLPASRVAWLFVAGFWTNLVIGVATLALIVPGLLLGLAWCLSPAVAAVEDRGIADMYGRSRELTRGRRLLLLALFIVYEVMRFALMFGVRYALRAPSLIGLTTGPDWLVFGLQPALSAALSLIYAAVMASTYLELRRLHEGGLASTFD